jgi:hypothetical protein
MDDPNVIYKARFRELTELLGRTPLTTDKGWLEITEEYKAAWTTINADRVKAEADIARAAGPVDNGFSREPAPQARSYTREEEVEAPSLPLSGPGINGNGVGAVSEPGKAEIKPEAAEGPARGPNGGVLAVCEACGAEWERPARRGRPALKCEGCR